MTAVTRWVEYDVSEEGSTNIKSQTTGTPPTDNPDGVGQRGYSIANGATGEDKFSIGAGNERLYVKFDGDTTERYITIASGVDLDPRFIARDITEKLHNLVSPGTAPEIEYAQCYWENNKFKLYSGTLGSHSGVDVVSGTQTAHLDLGWGTKSQPGGKNENTTGYTNVDPYSQPAGTGYAYGVAVSGTYNGFFDEEYTVVVNKEETIQAPVKGGANNYTGTITTGGVYNWYETVTYTLYINTQDGANGGGTTMGGGIGSVPLLSWTSSDSNADPSPADVDLLYPNHWYKVGTRGLMVKFTDAVFSHCVSGDGNAAWTIECRATQYTHGSNNLGSPGDAIYIYGSNRGDDSAKNATGPVVSKTIASGDYSQLGSRGLWMKFTNDDFLYAGNEFRVLCKGPAPKSWDITNLNYGNVTVSTEAPVKCVIFEIMSGAIEMSTVKFGLQSHGTFEHHNENNNDTFFRFGTVGPGNKAGSSPINGLEWRSNVLAADIDSDTQPSYLYGTKENLDVVSDADDSESIGSSSFAGMTCDPIWLNIKLGASEVGANSTINYRMFFDYS